MDRNTEVDDLDNPNKLRRIFSEEAVPSATEEKLLSSAKLRRALLESAPYDVVRRLVRHGRMSSELRSQLLNDIESLPVKKAASAPKHDRGNQDAQPTGEHEDLGILANNNFPTKNRAPTITGKRVFTAKRTTRLDKASPLARAAPKYPIPGPPEVASPGGRREVPNSPSPEPARIVSDIIEPDSFDKQEANLKRKREGSSSLEASVPHPQKSRDRSVNSPLDATDTILVKTPFVGKLMPVGDERGTLKGVEKISSKDTINSRGVTNNRRDSASKRSSPPGNVTDSTKSTETEWKYNLWTDSSGEIKSTAGALIPQGYKFHDDPHFPWICPVRSCRSLFSKLGSLGAHFNRAHRASFLNDNGDGTLSVVSRTEGTGVIMPAEVVSKRPLNFEESPLAEPRHTFQPKVRKSAVLSQSQEDRGGYTSAGVEQPNVLSSTPGSPIVENSIEAAGLTLWEYVQSNLKRTPLYPQPRRGHVQELLQHMSRRRDIVFNPDAQNPFNEARDQDISAMILQVCGQEAETPCSRCKEGKGPFKGCIIMPIDLPLSVRQLILGCANCFYKCNQTYCNLKQRSLTNHPELASGWPPRETPETPVAQSSPSRRTKTEKQPERRSLRNFLKEASVRSITARDSSQSRTPSEVGEIPNNAENEVGVVSRERTSPVNPAEILELETWEIAPGRIRDEQSEVIDNFAFSNAYLAQNQSVRIGHDVSFQVMTIKPGTVHCLGANANELRLCSVAAGKLQVSIHDQEFSMGPNGMIRIRPGSECTIVNRLYIDATVHITTVPGDLSA